MANKMANKMANNGDCNKLRPLSVCSDVVLSQSSPRTTRLFRSDLCSIELLIHVFVISDLAALVIQQRYPTRHF